MENLQKFLQMCHNSFLKTMDPFKIRQLPIPADNTVRN